MCQEMVKLDHEVKQKGTKKLNLKFIILTCSNMVCKVANSWAQPGYFIPCKYRFHVPLEEEQIGTF